MMRILDAQHIVPLDDLFALANHFDSLARGEKLNTALLNRMATRIADIPLSRASLSANEKNALSFGYWTDKHVDAERKLNLRAAVEKASGEKLKEVRGLLAPFLRDTLVAYNYVHYAPPGAQILYTNPLFVRGHDFLGMQGAQSHVADHGSVRFGLAFECGRPAGGLAGRPALCAGRGRTELPGSGPRPRR